jgi:pyruvate ferredoxin oxidoreductase gamma subunit/2-oxoisovalerate ferredoxin oxidoreductase gamma subunit
MLEVRIHGRGGQGAQVGCQILADAFFRAGHWVQAFAAYGGERRGAPVTASLRVDHAPIRVRCDIERPAYAIVLDPGLVAEVTAAALAEPALVVVNAPAAPCSRMRGSARIVSVDATAIARRTGLGVIVSTAMLGAFGALTGLVDLEHLVAAVAAGSPVKSRENVEACRAGWSEAPVDRMVGQA